LRWLFAEQTAKSVLEFLHQRPVVLLTHMRSPRGLKP
jgi:hypothetical protein